MRLSNLDMRHARRQCQHSTEIPQYPRMERARCLGRPSIHMYHCQLRHAHSIFITAGLVHATHSVLTQCSFVRTTSQGSREARLQVGLEGGQWRADQTPIVYLGTWVFYNWWQFPDCALARLSTYQHDMVSGIGFRRATCSLSGPGTRRSLLDHRLKNALPNGARQTEFGHYALNVAHNVRSEPRG